MKILVLAVLLFMSMGIWFTIYDGTNEFVGKSPSDEITVHTQERSKVTGELFNITIVKCRLCGQVLSYFQYDLHGHLKHADKFEHICGRIFGLSSAKYSGSAFGPLEFNLYKFLDKWQRLLRVKLH